MVKAINNSSLRVVIFYLVSFSTSVLLLGAFLYFSTIQFITAQTDSVIEAEINGLQEQYRKSGLSDLARVINRRISESPSSPSVYLLADSKLKRIAGNLTAWPEFTQLEKNWVAFQVRDHRGEEQAVRAKAFVLYGKYHLIVGRNVSTLTQLQGLILDALLWFAGLTISLGLIGGYIHAKRVSAKLMKINQACDQIISGQLTERIERDHSNDEFDQLAASFNTVLDSNYRLMLDVKRVSDNIAHDLKTPLSRLKNSLEQALMVCADEPTKDKLITSIEEADTLLGMFNSLLKIVSIENSQEITRADVNINTLLEDVYELYQPIAESKSINLIKNLPEQVCVKHTNSDLLFQALINVVDNGIKYTPEHGEVEIALQVEQNLCRILITDNGIGVEQKDLDKITTRFYRADKSRQLPGTGLGLSLVNAITKALSIELGLKSQQRGLRVEFTFELEPSGK